MSPISANNNNPLIVVFSDLDGSLLDHHDYSYAAARPGLDRLEAMGVPLVLATSKTRDEVQVFVEELGLDTPFIIENGGGILIPPGYFDSVSKDQEYEELVLSAPVRELQHVLDQARADGYQFRSMLEMDINEIVELTGLRPEEAERAARRHYTIPLVWRDDDERLPGFQALIESSGFCLLRGGRFYHLQGSTDKSVALKNLVRRYEQLNAVPVISIALGDSGNDRKMLETADYAIVIPSISKGAMSLEKKEGVFTASYPGPKGWNEGLMATLDRINQRISHE